MRQTLPNDASANDYVCGDEPYLNEGVEEYFDEDVYEELYGSIYDAS